MELKVVHTAAALDPYRDAWDLLASRAVEKNVFYESWMLLPALQHLSSLNEKQRVEIVLILDGDDLVALFPLERKRGYRGSPFSYFSFWRHIHCYLCAPLVTEEYFDQTFDLLLSWIRSRSSLGLLETGHFPQGTKFSALLDSYLERRGYIFDKNEQHDRAMISSSLQGEEYLKNSLRGRRLKDIRRKVNQLAQFGSLNVEELASDGPEEKWVSEFLEIEAEGWKGEEGTALVKRRSEQLFFERAVEGAHQTGKLRMMRLQVAGKTVAMTCDFITGGAGFAFKICYREEYSKYSPGLLLEIERVKHTLGDPNTRYLDSCSSPDNIMLNRVWSERRGIESRMIAVTRAGAGVVGLMKFLSVMKDTFTPHRPRLEMIKAPVDGESLESVAS